MVISQRPNGVPTVRRLAIDARGMAFVRRIISRASDDRLEMLINERLQAGADKTLIDKRIWSLFGERRGVRYTDLSRFSRNVAAFGIIYFLQTIYESTRTWFLRDFPNRNNFPAWPTFRPRRDRLNGYHIAGTAESALRSFYGSTNPLQKWFPYTF